MGMVTFYTSASLLKSRHILANLVVKSGCTLILDAESEVLFDKNVDVQIGGSIETVGKY